MKEIVLEGRPFSYRDFLLFEINGKWYCMKAGTYRNNICELRKKRIIELCYNSNVAFHTLKGHKFGANLMTDTRTGISPVTGVTSVTMKENMDRLYRYIETLNSNNNSIHDIHLLFKVPDIWKIFAENPKYKSLIKEYSKDIILIPEFIDDLKIQPMLHHTDSVTVSIACSKQPVPLNEYRITKLSCALARIEERLSRKLDECGQNLDDGYERIPIPDCNSWQVKLWHFGKDSPCEYADKGYSLTWGYGREVLRIYMKNINGKMIKREETQEYPEKSLEEALTDYKIID